MNKLFKTLTAIALTGTFVLSGLVFANANVFALENPTTKMSLNITHSGNVHLRGTVSAVSGSTVSVTSWGGTWTVNTTGANIPSGLAEVKVGDNITVNGKITTGMNIQAKTVIDHTKTPRPTQNTTTRTVSGVVSNFNATAGTLTLTTAAGNVNVSTNTATTVQIGGNVSTFASLSNGLTVTVAGSYNATTNTITATTIKSPASPIVFDSNHNLISGKFKNILKLFANVGENN